MRTDSSLQKLGERPYRNPSSGTYYALIKVAGKQIKSSLKTKNLPEARRQLKDYRNDLEGRDPNADAITLERQIEKFERTIRHLSFFSSSSSGFSFPARNILSLKTDQFSGTLQVHSVTDVSTHSMHANFPPFRHPLRPAGS